jgi:hypothetical protein
MKVADGIFRGIKLEVRDPAHIIQTDFVPGFYYSVGETEPGHHEVDDPDTIILEGPAALPPHWRRKEPRISFSAPITHSRLHQCLVRSWEKWTRIVLARLSTIASRGSRKS